MSLKTKLTDLANKAEDWKDVIQNEAQTRASLVDPFLQALGYDPANPREVVPEYTADIGIKKGEKVDYAILRDGEPKILIEVKHLAVELSDAEFSQLLRYFGTTSGKKIAILTNGVDYRFYADLDSSNQMDPAPFLEFNLSRMTPKVLDSLSKFTRNAFQIDEVLDTASGLRSLNGVKSRLTEEMNDPSEELIRLLSNELMEGKRYTKSVIEEFHGLVKQALNQFINERVQSRLTKALSQESERELEEKVVEEELPEGVIFMDGDIVTTQEEADAYERVRTLVGEVIDAQRVYMRDAKSYCSVIIDDNNRKPICRFYFDKKQKYIEIIDKNKERQRYDVDDTWGLTKYGAELREAAKRYVDEEAKPDEAVEA